MASPPRQAPVVPLELLLGDVAEDPSEQAVNSTSNTSSSPQSPASLSLALESPEGIDCHGNERQALIEQAKFFNNPLLSDVKLVVGNEQFFAHKLILVKASDVFERMFSSEWDRGGDDGNSCQEVTLVEDSICTRVFPRFLRFLYGCHVKLNMDTTLPVLILADKYNVVDLRNVCIDFARSFIIPKLQLKDVFHIWFQYATKCFHDGLVRSCVSALASQMDELMSSAEWNGEWVSLDRDQLVEFLRSSSLRVKDEYELWLAVTRWLQSPNHPERQEKLETHLADILEYIRFPMMTAEQLCVLESSPLVETYPQLFQKHIMQAYKFLALPLTIRAKNKDFTKSPFLLRNYSDLRWDKRFIVYKFSSYPKGAEVSFRFTTRASAYPAQTWEWELKVHPKGFSSTSDDFRILLYSNLILDQPRPVEYYLSIISNQQILKSVSGRKTFSKTRYTTDTEMDKKITVAELLEPGSPFVVEDSLILQITLRPAD
ncbi:BTB/POZ domain-containing protein 17-like [Babylonia areolata]|uniref:BTB/POZ domain-containing protein 17-like n=1 Tax=Babylonia areolata TaxID=304850 RepID=UPI003FD209C5